MEDVVIVGAGIGGLATALALHRLGVKSLILESSDALRTSGFAMSMWNNAWKALDVIGVGDKLRLQHMQILEMVCISTHSGLVMSKTSLNDNRQSGSYEVRFMQRKDMLEAIANVLPKGAIMYSTKVVSIEDLGFLKLLHLADGSTLKTKVLIGSDGVNSVAARWLGFKKPWLDGRYSIRGLAHFQGSHALKPTFYQCMGYGVRFGIAPCDDTSVYWFYIWTPSHQEKGMKDNYAAMKQFVKGNLGRVPDWIPDVIEKTDEKDILFSPLSLRPPWELVWGNVSKDNVCVVGDAFHPMTPDLGQGGGSALEDAVILAKYIGQVLLKMKTKTEVSRIQEEHAQIRSALSRYARERRWRAIGLTTTAYIVGSVQQSSGKMISFIREHLLASFLSKLLVKKGDYDCGLLQDQYEYE